MKRLIRRARVSSQALDWLSFHSLCTVTKRCSCALVSLNFRTVVSHNSNLWNFKLRVSSPRTIAPILTSTCSLKVNISQGLGPFFQIEPLKTGRTSLTQYQGCRRGAPVEVYMRSPRLAVAQNVETPCSGALSSCKTSPSQCAALCAHP